MKATVKSMVSSQAITRKRAVSRPALADLPTFTDVSFREDQIWFVLSDGRTVSIPLEWSKRLQAATPAQRYQCKLSAYNIFWDEVDEIIGVENVLYGKQGLYL